MDPGSDWSMVLGDRSGPRLITPPLQATALPYILGCKETAVTTVLNMMGGGGVGW